MSTETQENLVEEPLGVGAIEPQIEIIAVPAICHVTGKAPNRANRNRDYTEVKQFQIGEYKQKLRVLTSKKQATILFIMPDGRCYEMNAKIAIEKIVEHWSTPADAEAADADQPTEETENPESES